MGLYKRLLQEAAELPEDPNRERNERMSTYVRPVQDIERAKGFYRDTLGLQMTNEDGEWAEVDANGLTIGLNGREPSGAGATGGPVVAFQPEGSLEETVGNLKEQGVEVPAEISEHPWGRVATFKDSEGNVLQLYVPPSS